MNPTQVKKMQTPEATDRENASESSIEVNKRFLDWYEEGQRPSYLASRKILADARSACGLFKGALDHWLTGHQICCEPRCKPTQDAIEAFAIATGEEAIEAIGKLIDLLKQD